MKQSVLRFFAVVSLLTLPMVGFSMGDSIVSVTHNVRTFIPDGPYCDELYVDIPMEFTQFAEGSTLNSAANIASICLNLEHSFMGDVTAVLECPTGQKAVLFYGNPATTQEPDYPPSDNSPAAITGSGFYLGHPLDNVAYDIVSNVCDSLYNPFGVGEEYCFSRRDGYTLVTGDNAGGIEGRPAGNFYLKSNAYSISESDVEYPIILDYFMSHPGEYPVLSGEQDHAWKQPSNHQDKADYYVPYTDFSELYGCPVNGVWNLRVYDTWAMDNGWYFGAEIDFYGVMLEVVSSDEEMGSVSGGGLFVEGDTTFIYATPAEGYRFDRWSDGNTDNPRKVDVNASASYTAIFADALSVDPADPNFVKVYAAGEQVVVEGAEGQSVALCDMAGRVLSSMQAGVSPVRFNVPSAGSYLVKVGQSTARKVVVVK